MNILWLSHNVPYPPAGGVLQRNYNLLKRVAVDHRVHLLAFNQKALLPDEDQLEAARTAIQSLCAHVEILSIPSDSSRRAWYKLVLVSSITRDPYAINWLKSRQMHSTLRALLQRVRFDVVYYDTISLVEYFRDAAALPKVLNHHNVESEMMLRRAAREPAVSRKLYFHQEARKLRRAEQQFAATAQVNLAVSPLDAGRLHTISPRARIEVCANGTDVEYFKPKPAVSPEPAHLLFAGGLRWYPNRDAMLYFCREVWPAIAKELPESRLTIVGAHPPAELRALVRGDRRVTLTGYVEDVRPYFNSAGIFICPMRDGGGTRLKLLDAMAMGKPIVTTALGSEGLDLTPEEDVLIAETPGEFVAQIRRLVSTPSLRTQLGTRVRRIAEQRYSWETIGARLSSLFTELAAAPLPCGAMADAGAVQPYAQTGPMRTGAGC